MSRRFAVVLTHEPDVDRWSVEVPALPGCYSAGDTVDEALAHVRDAIRIHIQRLREKGERIPGGGEVQTALVEVA